MVSAELLQIVKALCTYVLALEHSDAACICAESARGHILLQDDLIVLNVDLKAVLNADVKSSSQFDRDNDSAEFINFSYDSCGLYHDIFLLLSHMLSI